MELIAGPLSQWDATLPAVALRVPRSTLVKRRWRGAAEDGMEFGFDLEQALGDGETFYADSAARYVMSQTAEPVLEIALPAEAGAAARFGWMIGNLHFPLEAIGGLLRVMDDPALRQLCERESWAFAACERVFRPLTGGHSH